MSAAALASVALLSPFSARASSLTTQPYLPTALSQSDWPAKIEAALRETGSVDQIASEVGTEQTRDPVVLRARYRVEIEQGRLEEALAIVDQLSGIAPADLSNIIDKAQLQQLLGKTTEAAQTLNLGIAAASQSNNAIPLRLRLAILFFDGDQTDVALQQLDNCVKIDPSASSKAGIIAFVFGKFDAASRYLVDASQKDSGLGLIEANAALEANQTDQAGKTFSQCLLTADQPLDKRYIQERLIATARKEGTLGRLADQWLSDDKLPPDRVLPLLTVLRELDRVPEILAWWRRAVENPAYTETALSQHVVQEVIGAAQSAKLTGEAETIAGKLLSLHPDNQQWLAANLQILLPDNKDEMADSLLRAQIERFADAPVQLHQVGVLAESFGRSALAIEAAKRLQQLGGSNAIAGQLLEASVLFDTGKPKDGSAILNQAAKAAIVHPEATTDVADAFEDAGQRSEAIAVLHQRFQQQADLDTAERLSSLLMLQDRSAEALPLLDYLRRLAPSAGLRTQARQHIVEIATTSGTLDDLIKRTTGLVNSPAATPDDVALLVDADVAAKDGKAAADLLQNTKLLSNEDRLQQRILLFRRLGNLDAADVALHQLLKADPAHAAQILQQIWSLAIKRNKPEEAIAAISQLQAQSGENAASLEMLASLSDGLGQPMQAAMYYRRAIALSEEGSEDWLLWATALAKVGQKDLAEHRLEALTKEARNDDMFAVAVDGLLNLRAGESALRAARCEAILRAAESPRNMTYCHLVSDISDELGDSAMSLAVIKLSIAMNREERPELLRQLLESAGSKGMVDIAIDAGRSLLSLGSDFPPQLFQELGEQLLIASREQDATRAFDRADDVSLDDVSGSVTRAAKLFQDYGYYDRAIAELNRVGGQRNTDPDYHETLGDLHERTGQPDAAFAQYMIAIRQISHSALEASDQPSKKKPSPTTAGSGNVMTHVSGSVDATGLSRVVLSASATARREEQQTQLLQELSQDVHDLAQHNAGQSKLPDVLATALTALRHASFCLHHPDFADRADRDVLNQWPDSQAIKQQALAERVKQGLYSNASQFAVDMEMAVPSSVVFANRAMDDSSASTRPAMGSAADEVASLPGMIALNQSSQANSTLGSILTQTDVLLPDQFAVTITAAVALGNSDAVDRLALKWAQKNSVPQRPRNNLTHAPSPNVQPPRSPMLPAAGAPNRTFRTIRSGGGGFVRQTPLQKAVSTSWRFLSADGRQKMLQQLVQASLTPDARLSDAPMVALQIAASTGLQLPDSDKIADTVMSRDGFDSTTAAQLFGLLSAGQLPAYIDRAMKRLPADQGLRFLIEIVGQTTDPFDDATSKAIASAADHLAKGQSYEWISWFSNQAQKAVLPAIAQAVIRNGNDLPLPQKAASFAAAALALSNAGDQLLADKTALEAVHEIDKLASSPPDALDSNSISQFLNVSFYGEWFKQACLRIAVAGMSTNARSSLIASLSQNQNVPSLVWPSLQRSVLLDANGQRDQALNLLRSAFAQDGMNQDLSIVYLDRLQSDGRLAEIVEAFSRPASLSSDATFAADFRRAVGQTLFLLYRPNEVHRFSKDTVGNPINITLNLFDMAATNDPDKLAQVFRSEVISSLHNNAGRMQTSMIQPSLEGLNGAKTRWRSTDENSAIAADIANWPGSIDDLQAELRPYPAPNSFGSDNGVSWCQKLLAQAIESKASNDPLVQSLLQSLEANVKSDVMTDKDLYLARTLAVMPGLSVPRSVVDDLWKSALADASGASFSWLADVLQAQHDPRAVAVEQLKSVQSAAVASQSITVGFALPGTGASAPLNLDPDPAPAETIDDVGLARSLGSLMDAGQLTTVESRVTALRKSGRITPDHIHCGLLWARIAAEQGNLPELASRLRQVLLTWSAQATGPLFTERAYRPVFNIRECLPSSCGDPAKSIALCKMVQDTILEQSNSRPDDCDLTRMLVALGDWSCRQADIRSAGRILDIATKLANQQGDGEHQLWVADLANELDQHNQSNEIEFRLLKERCLPPARIAPVLRRLQEIKGRENLNSLLQNAKSYCGEPSLQDLKF